MQAWREKRGVSSWYEQNISRLSSTKNLVVLFSEDAKGTAYILNEVARMEATCASPGRPPGAAATTLDGVNKIGWLELPRDRFAGNEKQVVNGREKFV